MIPPETLRRYPTSVWWTADATLRSVAMLAQERTFKAGTRLFEERGRPPPGEPSVPPEEVAATLMVGQPSEIDPMTILSSGKQVFLGTAGQGNLLGVSTMLEPREFMLTAIARSDSTLIALDATRLREVCEVEPRLGYQLMRQIARDLRGRLAQAVPHGRDELAAHPRRTAGVIPRHRPPILCPPRSPAAPSGPPQRH